MQSEVDVLAERRRAAREAYRSRTTRRQQPRQPGLRGWFETRRKAVIIAAALVAGVPMAASVADALLNLGRIHSGVYIGEVAVGRMAPEDAKALVRKEAKKALKNPLAFAYGGKEWSLPKTKLSPNPDVDRAVERAERIGRSGGILQRLRSRFGAYLSARRVPLGATLDNAVLDDFVATVAKDVDVAPRNATVLIEGKKMTIQKSEAGKALRRGLLKARILDQLFVKNAKTIALPVAVARPHVTEAEARQAREEAKLALSQPVTLTYRDEEWTLDPEDLSALLDFRPRRSGKGKKLIVGLEPDGFKEKLAGMTEKFRVEPKDATFITRGSSVSIRPHVEGEEIDPEAGRAAVEKVLTQPGERRVQLVLRKIDPDITTERAKSMGIKERIYGFTTSFNPGMTGRVTNIRLLSQALDGTLVAPGATFSFNGTVGPRTAAKGYKEAPVIRDGKLEPDIGGGVCQVATTVYNAIFFAGLPIVSRQNHSLYISHYPAGRDATVSWPAPDLKFRNDTGSYILIDAYASSSQVTVVLYGTDPDRDVSYRTSNWFNFTPFKTEKLEDPTLEKGKKVTEEKGKQGRSIIVRRVVKKDGKVLYEDTFTSRYRPETEVVRVGTKEPAHTSPTAAASTGVTTTTNP